MHVWLPTGCAPKDFPVEIISGAFSGADNEVTGIPEKAYLANGWGETGAINLIGEDEKPLPGLLSIKWFSFRERKFYEGGGKLPVREMEHLIQKGFLSPITGRPETYEYIVVGTAPEGDIIVWLKGNGITKEIILFKAREVQIDVKSFLGSVPSLDAYVRLLLQGKFTDQEIRLVNFNRSELSKWSTTYRTRFDWRLKVITSARAATAIVYFYNGESAFWASLSDTPGTNGLPIPKQLFLTWETPEEGMYVSKITFDETEIFAALDRLSAPGDGVMIQPEINTADKSLEVFVLNRKHVIKLTKCVIETY